MTAVGRLQSWQGCAKSGVGSAWTHDRFGAVSEPVNFKGPSRIEMLAMTWGQIW